jgi:hypothetical protein
LALEKQKALALAIALEKEKALALEKQKAIDLALALEIERTLILALAIESKKLVELEQAQEFTELQKAKALALELIKSQEEIETCVINYWEKIGQFQYDYILKEKL